MALAGKAAVHGQKAGVEQPGNEHIVQGAEHHAGQRNGASFGVVLPEIENFGKLSVHQPQAVPLHGSVPHARFRAGPMIYGRSKRIHIIL